MVRGVGVCEARAWHAVSGLVLIAFAALLLLPGRADAAVTCALNSATLEISVGAATDLPQISRSGSAITVTNGGSDLCTGGPTVSNVDTIMVSETNGPHDDYVIINLPTLGFGPGLTAEPTGTSEIEFQIDLGGGLGDSVQVTGGTPEPHADNVRFGSLAGGASGANLNAPEADGPDGDDLRLTNVESLSVFGGFAQPDADTIDAGGGSEFLDALDGIVLGASGGPGDDTLAGAKSSVTNLDGNEGDDTIISGASLDTMRGNNGTDTLSYARATASITIDMSIEGTAQSTGGGGLDTLDLDTGSGDTDPFPFENLIGSGFPDDLTATSVANDVVPGAGTDQVSLLGGGDTFNSLDQTADTIDCGAGADSGIADPVGIDTVTDCESVNRPPETTVTSGPANGALTNDPTPLYGLAANEPATFSYRLDGGPFSPCPASCQLPTLSDGTHQLDFRATDSTALVEQTPVSRSVKVDTAAPQTQIVSGPADGAKTSDDSATYGFSSEAGASFQCALDAGPFEGCSSPVELNGLADGKRTFRVRAVDAAGNADPTPAARSLVVDAVDSDAPETMITKLKLKDGGAKIRFTSDDDRATFECKRDRKPFKPCSSPKRYRSLDEGRHKVKVRAIDDAGNVDPTPARKRFEIE